MNAKSIYVQYAELKECVSGIQVVHVQTAGIIKVVVVGDFVLLNARGTTFRTKVI